MSIYFGGSRNLSRSPIISCVVQAVVASGQIVHVGCQSGADQQVVQACPPSHLAIFAVSPALSSCAWHIRAACGLGASVRVAAGGQSAPMPARYLLRSIAAFQGCESAVFLSPGSGSLAVARECVRAGLPVFAFGETPAPIPSVSGQWVASSFMGFCCWWWSAPTQPALF
jgi:hypothetical protein